MTVHESVAVGAFCYAAGAVFVNFLYRAQEDGGAKPDTKVFNFSHNPLDPAVGDLIFEDTGGDQMFYIVEFKKSERDIHDECQKRSEQGRSVYAVEELCGDYPTVRTAHLLAWIYPDKVEIAGTLRAVSRLIITPYWESLACVKKGNWKDCERWKADRWLSKVSDPIRADKPKGFSLDELERYILHVNEGATGKAGSGALSFVMTFRDYRIFAAEEQRALELLLQRKISLTSERQASDDNRNECSRPF